MRNLVFTAGLVACAVAASTTEVGAQSAGQWSHPSQMYAKVCGYCHDTGVGPDLKDRQLTPEYVATLARQGSNAMPSFRPSEFSDADLLALGKWLSESVVADKK